MSKLPCEECRGKCCQYPAMSNAEFEVIVATKPLPITANIIRTKEAVIFVGECPYLKDGRCSIHSVRPQTCRKYGEVPQMPCQYLYPMQATLMANAFLKKS